MVDKKQYYYVVKVIKTDYVDYEEEIYETEYEAEKNETDILSCVNVLEQAIEELK